MLSLGMGKEGVKLGFEEIIIVGGIKLRSLKTRSHVTMSTVLGAGSTCFPTIRNEEINDASSSVMMGIFWKKNQQYLFYHCSSL